MTDTGPIDGNDPDRTVLSDAGRRLENDYEGMFPQHPSQFGWQAAAANGATLRWALQVANTGTATYLNLNMGRRVGWAMRLAEAVPVSVIDGLLAYGWDARELFHLMAWSGTSSFLKTARRLNALHRTVPGTGVPGKVLLWHALAATLSADSAGLTDLQTLRWLQILVPSRGVFWASSLAESAMIFVDDDLRLLQEWVAATGPDGWAWAGAGYTLTETRALLALPVGHPGRPGPDQLAVMAALRQMSTTPP